MFKTLKPAIVGAGLFFAAGIGNVFAADGQEQARQLLQRSDFTFKAQAGPAISLVSVSAQDSHEQARRMIERSQVLAQGSAVQYEGVALIVKSDKAVDGHTQARNLLARPVGG